MSEDKLLWIIKELNRFHAPGKTVVQKMIYLLQQKGLELDYSYSIHYFGPYSSKLEDSLYRLMMQGAITIIPDRLSLKVGVTEGFTEIDETALNQEEKVIVAEVLETFRESNATDLEVLTTTDFVIKNASTSLSNAEIIGFVRKIKGDKFSESVIEACIQRLQQHGFLN